MPLKGQKMTQKQKEKISASRKGHPAWNRGKEWSVETKEKISNSKKGKPSWNKGIPHPKSVKEKIRRTMLAESYQVKPFYDRKICSKRLRFQVLQRDKFTCCYCGRKPPEVILEIDHIKPESDRGLTKLDNLVTSCRDCNRGKSNLILGDKDFSLSSKW